MKKVLDIWTFSTYGVEEVSVNFSSKPNDKYYLVDKGKDINWERTKL